MDNEEKVTAEIPAQQQETAKSAPRKRRPKAAATAAADKGQASSETKKPAAKSQRRRTSKKASAEKAANPAKVTKRETEKKNDTSPKDALKGETDELPPEKAAAAQAGLPGPRPQPAASAAEEKQAEPTSEKPAAEEEKRELTPEERAAEERRAAELTRTVQVSIEQIMEHAAAQQAEHEPPPQPVEEPAEEEETQPVVARIGRAAGSGLLGLLKWVLLVLLFVAIIAGFGVYWLYRSATPDMVPQITLTIEGQTLEPTTYRWEVPVVGNMFKREYAETLSTAPIELETPLESAAPEILLAPSDGYETELVISDAEKQEIYDGTLSDFSGFTFTENGDYTGKLVVKQAQTPYSGNSLVTGSQTYQFAFSVDIRPTVRINTQSITQGGVVALRVTGVPEGDAPVLDCTLDNTGFVQSTNGWVAYLPIPCDADTSNSYVISVRTQGYDQTLSLTVRPRTSSYKDYSSNSQLTKPYIGLEDTPAEVTKILDICDPQVYWVASGFVQPFIRNITVTLPFGTTEYVGRTATQRANNTGTGRIATNVVVTGRQGETLICPADGRVVLAENLGDTAGNTVVVEHGAGLKSIFYNLRSINVTEGDPVVQGQTLGMTNKTTIGEVRIGRVPVEPLAIWRGQCDAVKNY